MPVSAAVACLNPHKKISEILPLHSGIIPHIKANQY